MDGFFVIDKPAGMTSHDVVAVVRRIIGQKKVGHTGTLDPFATGVLPVAVGEATKAIPFLDEAVKEYQAVMRLGIVTETQDCTGTVLCEGDWTSVSATAVHELFRRFTGPISQLPPMFSAVKMNGVPLYRLARKGQTAERKARHVLIESLVVDRLELPDIAFTVRCSRGTYVRTLAHDMGEVLGCGAHLAELRRTLSGPFPLAQAISINELTALGDDNRSSSVLISPGNALVHLRKISLTEKGCTLVRNGGVPASDDFASPPDSNLVIGDKVLLMADSELVAVAEVVAHNGNEAVFSLARVFA